MIGNGHAGFGRGAAEKDQALGTSPPSYLSQGRPRRAALDRRVRAGRAVRLGPPAPRLRARLVRDRRLANGGRTARHHETRSATARAQSSTAARDHRRGELVRGVPPVSQPQARGRQEARRPSRGALPARRRWLAGRPRPTHRPAVERGIQAGYRPRNRRLHLVQHREDPEVLDHPQGRTACRAPTAAEALRRPLSGCAAVRRPVTR